MSFEEAIARLEAIVQQLEAGSGELDVSLRLFEEGMQLAKACEEILGKAEGRIEELLGDAQDAPPDDLRVEEGRS
ncbi:MAG: exodeoxyribonuclease VII small subunit [Thermaerobacter sp.]|nr:exodeoxyribonuclease VII small subunit [Thermaerobacter sp.]